MTLSDASHWSANFESISSTSIVKSTSYVGGPITLDVYEWISIDWRSIPKKNILHSPEELSLRSQFPEKYGVGLLPDRLINSGIGVDHQLTLAKSGNAWLIVSDGYREPGIAGSSPDYVLEATTPSVQNLKVSKSVTPSVTPFLTNRTFDYNAAIAYAVKWSGATD